MEMIKMMKKGPIWNKTVALVFVVVIISPLYVMPSTLPPLDFRNQNLIYEVLLKELLARSKSVESPSQQSGLSGLQFKQSSYGLVTPSWTYTSGFDPHGPHIDRLVFRVSPAWDQDSALQALIDGTVDAMTNKFLLKE